MLERVVGPDALEQMRGNSPGENYAIAQQILSKRPDLLAEAHLSKEYQQQQEDRIIHRGF